MLFVKLYPFALILVSFALTVSLGIEPYVITLPSPEGMQAALISIVLLLINHTWLMTATELTRGKFKLQATPEEWAEKGQTADDASKEGLQELTRHHNAHRNTTENTLYFVLLATLFLLTSPSVHALYVLLVGFSVARLGYTYSYLVGNTNLHGIFMSLTLIATYSLALSLLVRIFA